MSARLFFIAIVFGLLETGYFGWNWTPQSGAEAICDGITAILTALAVLAMRPTHN